MDLRGIANAASNTVNPNVTVTVLASTGATQAGGPGTRRAPSYAAPVSGPAQIQELSSADLKQLDGLNIQSITQAIYLRGALAGVIRPESKGGDILKFNGQTWLVAKVLESWPLWTKAAITLQVS